MNKNYICILVVGLTLQGCASGATPGAMVVPLSAERVIAADSPLHKNVNVGEAKGGKETSPLWKSNISNSSFSNALRQTLSVHTILSDNNGARFLLNAEIQEIKQPLVGFSYTVTSKINYTLTEVNSNKLILETTIIAPYEAKFSDSFYGAERLKLANEGSIRENIRMFVDQLVQRAADDPAFKFKTESVAPADTPSTPNS